MASKLLDLDFSDLRETLYAARLLREETLEAPVRPSVRARLSAEFLVEVANPPANAAAIGIALRAAARADTGGGRLDRDLLERLAAALGATGPRRGAGATFLGIEAPRHSQAPALLGELLETAESGHATEVWPPPVRAFAIGFLLRLVQPWDCDAQGLAAVVEAYLLAADGFRADRLLLPEARVEAQGKAPANSRPDPGGFVRDRLDRLVERLWETRERVRAATALDVLLAWSESREARLNARQRGLLRHLAGDAGRSRLGFGAYVRLHAGRRAPSPRSLQRDWKELFDRGLLEGDRDAARLRLTAFAFGGAGD